MLLIQCLSSIIELTRFYHALVLQSLTSRAECRRDD